MRCMVTGAAGFIGSHLCERLIEDGHEVVGLDNLCNSRIVNLDSILQNSRFKFVMGDVTHSILDDSMEGIEWCFHLAAMADIVPSIENPVAYHNSNVTGTIKVLEAARKHGVRRFVYAASSSCYGIPDIYPTKESYDCDPRYPYALTKLMGEVYVEHWAQVYKLSTACLRLFNVYGPRHRTSGSYGAVFGTFLAQIANEVPCTVVGDGSQVRDFTFVTDVCDAFVKAADSRMGGVFNIGTGHPRSVMELVHLLGGNRVIHLPKRPGEPDRTEANIQRAIKFLNWEPKVSFEEGCAIMKKEIPKYKTAPVWTPAKIEEATKKWFEVLS